jgi:voltage-gated potassium channel
MLRSSAREALRTIIFEHDTPAGRAFDVTLILAILLSVLVVMLDSVPWFRDEYGGVLLGAEWVFTLLFSTEYLLRLWSARNARGYALSFYGVIDLLAILPTYLAVLFPAGRFLAVVRILRIIRVFRVLKLVEYVRGGATLARALFASRYKIAVFLITVLSIVVIVGSLMYLIEGPESGFTSIPQSVYWAVVTLTTVGYGDIAPVTAPGKALAATLMILGYAIIAVPTGIVTLELDRASHAAQGASACSACGHGDHDSDARYCKRCGAPLPTP